SVFTSDAPATYGAKVKNVLIGLPLSDAELSMLTANPSARCTLVDGWMTQPQFKTKLLRFYQLAFQQTQIGVQDYRSQVLFDGALKNADEGLMQNLQESFARTALDLTATHAPFN